MKDDAALANSLIWRCVLRWRGWSWGGRCETTKTPGFQILKHRVCESEDENTLGKGDGLIRRMNSPFRFSYSSFEISYLSTLETSVNSPSMLACGLTFVTYQARHQYLRGDGFRRRK